MNTYVHVDNVEDYEVLIRYLWTIGLHWILKDSLQIEEVFQKYKEDTCINISNRLKYLTYATCTYARRQQAEIVNFKDYIKDKQVNTLYSEFVYKKGLEAEKD